MTLIHSIETLLQDSGVGQMRSTAYDTAWIARLAKLNEPMGFRALDWLRTHQLADGSWGAEELSYYHDRLVCTLAAATALARHGDPQDAPRLQRAKVALQTVIPPLADEAMIETIGYELIVPTLFAEAEKFDLVRREDYPDLEYVHEKRMAKLSKLPGGIINRYVTLTFSGEMAGYDGQRLLDIANLQEANGSLGHSPSATAYFALHVKPNDQFALDYLRNVPSIDGGIPDVHPFDIFEPAWVLWNLSLLSSLDKRLNALCERHLDFIENAWIEGRGVGFAAGYTPKDGDETAVAFEVLKHYERNVDIDPLLEYEMDDYFRCYALEANPSVSTNIHVLGALRRAGYTPDDPSTQKIIGFLSSAQYWLDKWHSSPYYPTSHAVVACAGYADWLVEDAISWILSTQNADGSWGYFMPTAEETAYCLQALAVWKRNGHAVDNTVLQRGAEWLTAHADEPYPPLWIGKCLYSPTRVIQSTIFSALALVTEEIGETVC